MSNDVVLLGLMLLPVLSLFGAYAGVEVLRSAMQWIGS